MSKKKTPSRKQKSKRNFYVFTSLAGVLTLTGGFLVATAPSPLRPDNALAAALSSPSDLFQTLSQTHAPIQPNRWKYIYVHHSRTPDGSQATGDHFLLANGNGAPDGQILAGPRWMNQSPALPPPGSASIDPACLSIGLVGDFDFGAPTPAQTRQLSHLIRTLQSNLQLPTHCVILLEQPGSAAAVGRHFPVEDYKQVALR